MCPPGAKTRGLPLVSISGTETSKVRQWKAEAYLSLHYRVYFGISLAQTATAAE
jgi:hypothetical protein